MSSPFERFDNTTAIIAEMTDYNDYENTYTVKEIGNIMGDLQPYMFRVGGGFRLSQKEYGLSTDFSYKFFCNPDENIKVGRYMIIEGQSYRIEYIAQRRLRYEVLLKEAEIDGRREQDNEGNTEND